MHAYIGLKEQARADAGLCRRVTDIKERLAVTSMDFASEQERKEPLVYDWLRESSARIRVRICFDVHTYACARVCACVYM
jgi:hypothetical protein